MWNYLRVRGEYEHARIPRCYQGELPPRARRILLYAAAGMGASGTTSACAENTAISSIACLRSRNYLRVRGEYSRALGEHLESLELPPRARRIPLEHTAGHILAGTTSACAENTVTVILFCTAYGNYLRVRGEYMPCFSAMAATVELPPRARRIQTGGVFICANNGTTSACAENTEP